MPEPVQPENTEDELLQPDSGPGGNENSDQHLAEDETADSASSAGEGVGEDGEELVPLRHLLDTRSKLTQAQQRERELAEWKETYEPLLLEFQARVPEYRQAIVSSHQLAQEKEFLLRQMDAYKAAIKQARETGDFDFDPEAKEREYALMQGLQKLNQIDSILDQKLAGIQEQFQRQQQDTARYMEQTREKQGKESKFLSELDKILEKAPELESQRESFMRQHSADPDASAQEIAGWAAELARRARVTRAAGKNAAARRQPKSASGPSAISPGGDGGSPTSYAGMTIRQIVEAKRKERQNLA